MSDFEIDETDVLASHGGAMKLANSAKRVDLRPEGISLTPAEFRAEKMKRILVHMRKEKKRQKKRHLNE